MIWVTNLFAAMTCSSVAFAAHVDLFRPTPTFRPERFFDGGTIGQGTVRILLGRHHPTLVHGSGHIDNNGTLILEQDVKRAGESMKHRQWQILKIATGRYAGTLTDASGPIEGFVSGNLLTLKFPMKGGLRAEQRLYLSPGGQRAENFMKIRKAGILVATVNETIRRVPANDISSRRPATAVILDCCATAHDAQPVVNNLTYLSVDPCGYPQAELGFCRVSAGPIFPNGMST